MVVGRRRFVFWLDMIPSMRFASCRLRLCLGFKVYFFGQNLHNSLGAKHTISTLQENMMDYIKRLKVCIRWFQDLEISYSLEQEKLKSSLELAQQKCTKIG